MKPETRERPFNRAGWVFELKYDGFRMLAAGGAGEARLFYKSGHDATRDLPGARARDRRPAVARPAARRRGVVLDDGGAPQLPAPPAAGAAHPARRRPARRGGEPGDALRLRPPGLRGLRPAAAAARRAQGDPAPGGAAGRPLDPPHRRRSPSAARTSTPPSPAMGLEGIVAKRADSPYRSGYSADWLKVRVDRSSDFAVVGFEPGRERGAAPAPPRGARTAARGWSTPARSAPASAARSEDEIRARLDPLRRATPPLPRGGRPRARSGWSPSWWSRSATRSGPTAATSATPSSCACATTRRPASASARGRSGRKKRQDSGPQARTAAGASAGRLHQPRQGLLAGGGDHQGGPDRLLPRGRPLDAAVPARPPADARPLSGRHRRQVVLPEDAPARDRPRRSPATTSRGCSIWSTWGRSRSTSAPAASEALERPDWCILDLDPKSGAVRPRGADRARHPRAVRRDRAPLLRQDERRQRPARPAADGRAARARAGAAARRAARRGDRGAAAGDRHHRPRDRGPRRPGLRRRPAERPRQAPGRPLLRPPAARAPPSRRRSTGAR